MIANTRKMREVQDIIRSILEEEFLLCDMFNSLVDSGKMNVAELKVLAEKAQQPNLHASEIISVKREAIMNNPYLKNINVPNIKLGNFQLTKKRIIAPGSLTKWSSKHRDLNTMRQVNSYFTCDKSLRFPGIVEGDQKTCWMTVEPCEINSFNQFINEATGNILLIGCGLGYVAYMLSRKEDVTSITVVDNNQDVLDLFTTHILQQFPNKDKIKTVNSDGLDYLRTADLSIFDHVNVDIWYDTIDMIYPYLRCLEIEKDNPQVKFSYWLEDELKYDIQKGILIAATRPDCVEGKKDTPLPENSIANIECHTFLTDIIGKDLVDTTPIDSYEDLHNLVDIKDLRALLLGWYANNLEKVNLQEAIDTERARMIKKKEAQSNRGLPIQHSKVFVKY